MKSDWTSDASSLDLSGERPEFDRVLAFAVGLGLKHLSPVATAKIDRSNLGYKRPVRPTLLFIIAAPVRALFQLCKKLQLDIMLIVKLTFTFMHSKDFIEEMKQKLLGAKDKLGADLSKLAAHTEMGSDMGENAEEIEVDEVNQDLIATMKSDLEKIDNALAKIDSGNYGVDDEGKEISEDRLRAIPWADKAI